MRDRRDRDWFWLDNAVVDRTDLNIYEKMLYMCMARHTGGKDYCFPSLDLLCKELGLKDTRTVVKYIRSLENKGLITVEKIKGKSNRYYLNNVSLPTPDVPTYDVPPTCDATTPPTSDVPSSTHMGCTPKKINIKKININKTTTTLDTVNKIDPETSEKDTNSSSSSFDIIKNMLEQHGISNNTKMNIMVLVRDENITPERVAEVLKASQFKHWQEGAIYTALRDNWKITDIDTEQAEKQKQREKSAKIDEQIKKSSQEFQAVKDKVNAEHQEKDELMQYMGALPQGIQNNIKNIALLRAKEKYPFGFKTMLNTLVIYEVIREYKSGILKL